MTEPPLRVLSVTPSMARNIGGPAIGLVQSTLAMGERVHRSIYCTDAARPAASPEFVRLTAAMLPLGAEAVDLHVFRTRRPYSFATSPSLFRAIGKVIRTVDLVTIHSLNLFPQFAAFVHALRTSTPYIVTPHGALDPWLTRNSPKQKAVNNLVWQTRMLSNASALQFTTAAESRLVASLAPGVPRYIVPNGVRFDAFRRPANGRAFRDRYLAGHSGPVVMFSGRIARKKGIDLLLSAFAEVPTDRDGLLVVVGPDDEGLTPALRAQAERLGISGRVRFTGPLYDDELRAALASADIWALTSHTENFGNAVIEAMAAGLPVLISTAVNVSPEVAAAEAGCVTTLEVDEIAGHINKLIADARYRDGLAKRAVSFAQRFDWSTVASELLTMYASVVASKRVSLPEGAGHAP